MESETISDAPAEEVIDTEPAGDTEMLGNDEPEEPSPAMSDAEKAANAAKIEAERLEPMATWLLRRAGIDDRRPTGSEIALVLRWRDQGIDEQDMIRAVNRYRHGLGYVLPPDFTLWALNPLLSLPGRFPAGERSPDDPAGLRLSGAQYDKRGHRNRSRHASDEEMGELPDRPFQNGFLELIRRGDV
jgi:hypothetical protein